MRRLGLAALMAAGLIGPALLLRSQQAAPPQDPELQAMRDELERSRHMSLPNLEPPYFVQYLIDESTNFSVSASLGGLLSRRHEVMREPEVRIRVGDYKFD